MDYNFIFKKFYNNVILKKESTNNKESLKKSSTTDIEIDRGLAMCLLSYYINSNDNILGIQLSSEDIFRILKIENDNYNLDIISDFMVVRFNSEIRVFSLTKAQSPTITQICHYTMNFITDTIYSEYISLISLADELGLKIYSKDAQRLLERFEHCIQEYLSVNLSDIICIANNLGTKTLGDNFTLRGEI